MFWSKINRLSPEGLAFLKSWEGLKLQPYRDSGGLLTVGYGHALSQSELKSGKVYVGQKAVYWRHGLYQGEADILLEQDLLEKEQALFKDKNVRLLPQSKFDALISLVFNIGIEAWERSTLRKLILQNRPLEAGPQFLRWVFDAGKRVPGLERRRLAEKTVWDHGVYASA